MTAQFQFFQSLPHKKADFVKKKPIELGVVTPGGLRLTCGHEIHILSNLSAVIRMPLYMLLLDRYDLKELGGVWSIIGQDG